MKWYLWVLIGILTLIISVKAFFAFVELIFWDEEGYRKPLGGESKNGNNR